MKTWIFFILAVASYLFWTAFCTANECYGGTNLFALMMIASFFIIFIIRR